MTRIAAPPPPVRVDPPCSLALLCEQYRRHALSVRIVVPDTAKAELLYLGRFFAHFGPPESPSVLFASLVPKRLDAFLGEYAEGHGPGSLRNMKKSLRSFLRFAHESGYVERDLSALVPAVRRQRLGRVPRALPEECIATLMTGIGSKTPANLRDSAIVSLLATYGVRGVQLRQLRLDDIDWDGSLIRFPSAKGGHPILVPLAPKAGNRLAEYIVHGRPDSPHPEVFLTLAEPFRPFTCSSELSAVLRRRMKQLGVEPPEGVSRGTHGFRHAFATRLVGQVPFKDLVDLLGHRDPSSTLIYGKVSLGYLRQATLRWPGGEQ